MQVVHWRLNLTMTADTVTLTVQEALERLHSTHREEGLGDYFRALEGMARWGEYCNYKRPHSALKYLRPFDYYRGDPAARLAEREEKLMRAAQARVSYWQSQLVKEPGEPS